MSPNVAAFRRRTKSLARARGQRKATRKLQTAIAVGMVHAAYAPLTALNAKIVKQRKARKRAVGRSLGLAMTQLRTGRALMAAQFSGVLRPKGVPDIPEGAQYLARRYRCAAGARRYKLYLPASQPKRPKGLIVMLHGCQQTPDDFALGTHMNHLAERHGMAIVYPAQTRHNNAASCWNWFRPGDQARGAGEPAILAALTRKLMKDLGVVRDRTFVAGLSAGGAMAAILVDEYPELFAAAGIHSGLPRGAAHDVLSAMAVMRDGGGEARGAVHHDMAFPVRRILFHGEDDTTVHPSNAAGIVASALGELAKPEQVVTLSAAGRTCVKSTYPANAGSGRLELWIVSGAGHAWSGGQTAGSFTDSKGPDASSQMIRFFLSKSN